MTGSDEQFESESHQRPEGFESSQPAQNQDTLKPEEMRRALHELQIRQVELAARNAELLRVQEELRQSNELLTLFMQHSPIYAFIKEVTASESRVLTASENYRDMVGIPGSEMKGKTMEDLFPAEFAAKITADDWAVVTSGQVLKVDEDFNGRSYTTIKFPIFRDGKNLLAGYTIDITERKQAEQEREKLEFQNHQLQKTESLGRMAGAIAHHFNNQIQAVMMSLQLIKNDLPRNAESASYLDDAMQSAFKAAEISGMMLTYLGKTFTKRESVDLSEACRSGLPLLKAAFPRNVSLEVDLPSPGPVIHANASQMQQVLVNLVTNAWEAINSSFGIIRVSVHSAVAADISTVNRFPIDFQARDMTYACVEVTDSGCGISEKDFEKLFDPFYTSKFTGRGLGLPVLLGIVRAHRGVVTVHSKLNRGSIFRVYLPLLASAPAAEAQC